MGLKTKWMQHSLDSNPQTNPDSGDFYFILSRGVTSNAKAEVTADFW